MLLSTLPDRRLFLLIAAAILPLLGFEIHNQLDLRDSQVAEARQDAMRWVNLVQGEQDRIIEDIRHVLATMASVGGDELTGADCQPSMDRIKTHLPDYLVIEATDRHGVVRCATDPRSIGAFIGDRSNVQGALATDAFTIGDYAIAANIGHPIVPFALPFHGADGRPAGVLTALLDVRWLVDFLARKPLPPDAAVALTDRHGTILARVPEIPGLVGQPLPDRYRSMTRGPRGGTAELVGFDGTTRIVAYSRAGVDQPDLMVWVGLSKAQAMRLVEQAMWRTVGVFIGLLALAGMLVAWGVARFTRVRAEATRTALKMARVLESTTDAVLEVDRDWRVVFMNERARRLVPNRTDPLGQILWEAYPEVVGSDTWSRCQETMASNVACEFAAVGPLTGRWYAARAFPTPDGLAVFFQDITARKQVEEERERLRRDLEKERTLLKGVLAHLPSGVFAVAAPDGRLLLHNATAERLLGHSVVLAQHVQDYAEHGAIHADGCPYRPEEYPLARALLKGETVMQEEMLYRRGDGRLTTFAVSAAPVRDPEGRTVMAVSNFQDISGSKRLEEELRRSNERLSLALKAAQAGMFDVDLQTDEAVWSEHSYWLLGLDPARTTPSLDAWAGRLHPDDRDCVLAAKAAAMSGRMPEIDVEYRVVHPDDTVRWLAARGRVTSASDGTPLRMTGLNIDITARKQAEEALRRSEERLSFALVAASAGLWDWDIRTGELTWSEGLYALHGQTPDRFAPSAEAWLRLVHPDDRAAIEHAVQSALNATKSDCVIEHRILHPERGERWLVSLGRVTRASDGSLLRLSGISLDVTERKQIEEALRRSEESLALALASARAGTFDWDMRTGAAVWSPERYRLFGLDPEPGRGGYATWLNAIHPDDREAVLARCAKAVAERRSNLQAEYRAVQPDGAVRWLMAVGRITYDAEGCPQRMVGIDVDITERKEMEEALRAAKREAERADVAKSRFLAAASHDLRQPLQALFLFAAALHGQVLTERGQRALATLERNLEALKGLLDGLLDISRLDADVIRPTFENVPIASALDEIGASFAPVVQRKGLEFTLDVACDVVVRSDRTLLGRMIRNLVENAIKYTEHGSVSVTCRVVDGRARIEVSDTGIGIPADEQDLIFQEFHQVGNPDSDQAKGLGLGLSIVQRLAKLLDHPVTVRSTPGQGSVFTLDLPLGATDTLRPRTPSTSTAPDDGGRLAGRIEDETDASREPNRGGPAR